MLMLASIMAKGAQVIFNSHFLNSVYYRRFD